jgi:hypothetical protein
MRPSPDALPDKPDDMFDRDVEWMELAAFTADERPGCFARTADDTQKARTGAIPLTSRTLRS